VKEIEDSLMMNVIFLSGTFNRMDTQRKGLRLGESLVVFIIPTRFCS